MAGSTWSTEDQDDQTASPCTSIRQKIMSTLLSIMALVSTSTGGVGTYFHELGYYPHLTGPIFIPTATIALGVITLAIIGLTQAIISKPSRKMIGIATLIVGITAACTGITAAISLTEEYNADERIVMKLQVGIQSYTTGTDASNQIDNLQRAFECCGADSYRDYSTSDHYHSGKVPTSCCIKDEENCDAPPLEGKIFMSGCSEPLAKAIITATNSCTITLALLAGTLGLLWMVMMCGWTFSDHGY